jgi:hypothetical protein
MQAASKAARTLALRIGLLELAIVLIALIFVRKEIYLHGQFNALFLQWQEYAVLIMIFIDGACRGFAECATNGQYLSPFRKPAVRVLLTLTLFLFLACATMCDKANMAAIHQQWWRDAGVFVFALGVFVSIVELRNRPKGLEIASSDSAIFALHNSFIDGDVNESPSYDGERRSGAAGNTITTADNNTVTFGANAVSRADDSVVRAGKLATDVTDLVASPGVVTGSVADETSPAVSTNSEVGDNLDLKISSESKPCNSGDGVARGDMVTGSAQRERSDSQNDRVEADIKIKPASGEDIIPMGPWKTVRYPDRSAMLLELVGISMALSAWLPLLTLPGLIVALKWEISDLEAFRIRKLGEKYINYKKHTWFLIPYIY